MTKPAATKISPEEITWKLNERAHRELKPIRDAFGDEEYLAQISSLRKVLCAYFSGDNLCASKSQNISPLGGIDRAGKALKVRWLTPGGGKSGGLRMSVAVYCEEKLVVVKAAIMRRDADDFDFLGAASTD